jgi:DNA helicase-2/ATP-dependent DNA helicase PcrA
MARLKINPMARMALDAEILNAAPRPAPLPIPAYQIIELADFNLAPAARRVYNERKVFKPSQQQQDFLRWVQDGRGSAVLIAVAGAGKTTTLIEALPYLDGAVFFGAYNKAAAADIKKKAAKARYDRPGIFMSTVHGAGYNACFRAWGKKVEVTDRKVELIIDEQIKKAEYGVPSDEAYAIAEMLRSNTPFVKKMVSFGKQYLMGVHFSRGHAIEQNELRDWGALIEHFSMQAEISGGYQWQQLLPAVELIYKISHNRCPTIIDFDDMVYAPIAHNLHVFKNDWVILDEVQDINLAREELAFRMMKFGGRFIGVGDDRQAIYGFTGAGGGGIARIAKRFNAQKLPLTVTYRCPKTVVHYVRQWVDHIQAHPDAPDGAVRSPKIADATKPWYASVNDLPSAEDAILCRNTRPLVQTAFKLIRSGVACKVEGRDIGHGLIKIATQWRITKLSLLGDKLKVWLAREIEKAQAVKSERKEQAAQDIYDTMMVFMEKCQARGAHLISDLVTEIEQLFGDDVTGMLTLCTGHKAKGREWPRVYWLATSSGRQPEKEWERIEEVNIRYVIGTRAQKELILVPE